MPYEFNLKEYDANVLMKFEEMLRASGYAEPFRIRFYSFLQASIRFAHEMEDVKKRILYESDEG